VTPLAGTIDRYRGLRRWYAGALLLCGHSGRSRSHELAGAPMLRRSVHRAVGSPRTLRTATQTRPDGLWEQRRQLGHHTPPVESLGSVERLRATQAAGTPDNRRAQPRDVPLGCAGWPGSIACSRLPTGAHLDHDTRKEPRSSHVVELVQIEIKRAGYAVPEPRLRRRGQAAPAPSLRLQAAPEVPTRLPAATTGHDQTPGAL
jgi:hypothetical protein